MKSENILKLGVFKKLKGYSSQLRQDYLLLKLGLTGSELILFRLLLEIFTDWDSRHPKYGIFVFDSREISFLTGWSQAKIMRLFRRLKNIGLIKEFDIRMKEFKILGYKDRIPLIKKCTEQSNSDGLIYIDYLRDILLYKSQKNSEQNVKQKKTYLKKNKQLMWDSYAELKQEIADLINEQSNETVRKISSKSKSRFNLVSSKFESSFNTGLSSKDKEEIDLIVSDVPE